MQSKIDFTAIGYPAVRNAFNQTLQLCVDKLTNADFKLAFGVLDCDGFDNDSVSGGAKLEDHDVLEDAALYSCRDSFGTRPRPRRAIDRIVRNLPVKRDRLNAAIAERLPKAIFSVFKAERVHEDGGVVVLDLLDDGRVIHIMDYALAESAALNDGMLFAGRFVDLGPWYVGVGVVAPMRKSEALAIRLVLSYEKDTNVARRDLHELVYLKLLHDEDLVMTAMTPMIAALALAIDSDSLDLDEVAANFESLLPGNSKS